MKITVTSVPTPVDYELNLRLTRDELLTLREIARRDTAIPKLVPPEHSGTAATLLWAVFDALGHYR